MRAKAARARHPGIAPWLFIEAVDGMPGFAAIAADEQSGFRNAGVQCVVCVVQRPYLVDEASTALKPPSEIRRADDAMVLCVAAVFCAEARCSFELPPLAQIVAHEH